MTRRTKAWNAQLAACESLRTPLVSQINTMLNSAAFSSSFVIDPLTAQSLTEQANELVTDMEQLNQDATPPNYDLCGGTPPNPTGPQGPAGTAGTREGPAGPQGPRGPQGPAGKTPKVVCTVKIHRNQIISVTCKEVGVSKNARAVVALSRGKRIVGWGDGPFEPFDCAPPPRPSARPLPGDRDGARRSADEGQGPLLDPPPLGPGGRPLGPAAGQRGAMI